MKKVTLASTLVALIEPTSYAERMDIISAYVGETGNPELLPAMLKGIKSKSTKAALTARVGNRDIIRRKREARRALKEPESVDPVQAPPAFELTLPTYQRFSIVLGPFTSEHAAQQEAFQLKNDRVGFYRSDKFPSSNLHGVVMEVESAIPEPSAAYAKTKQDISRFRMYPFAVRVLIRVDGYRKNIDSWSASFNRLNEQTRVDR